MNEQARHVIPPNRVRQPTGCSFASGCSPPRLAATQLPLATQVVTSYGMDFHLANKASSRTHIGVEKGRIALPALRTVQAVFPHTALQSVVSSSGVSRGLPGRIEGEQPGIREEGIVPALLVRQATPDSRALCLLAQQRPQSAA